jgi:hypothetical protein
MPATPTDLMSDHAMSDTPAPGARASEATSVSVPTSRWRRLDVIKAFVVTAVFVLMVTSALRYGTDLPFDLAMATFWTALVALVWELGARGLARLRQSPDAVH